MRDLFLVHVLFCELGTERGDKATVIKLLTGLRAISSSDLSM